MKLEVENPPSTNLNGKVSALNSDASPAPDSLELLNLGIRSAQAGNRAEARVALFKVTETDPSNESAWLWLASISEYPEELLVFLNHVLEINPTNHRAMEWKVATNSLLAKTFVQRGIDAVEGNRKDFAAECFNRALEYDQNNEMAWLWMASLSDTNEGKLNYLEMVLKIDPNNEAAIQAYAKAKAEIIEAHLAAAKAAASLGQKAEATELLNAVIEEDPNCEDAWMLRSHFADTFDDKIASFNEVLRINPANSAARLSLDSLQSLIGNVGGNQPTVESEGRSTSLGAISSSNLFAYEPEMHRNPTQDLEFPQEKLEELREFEARSEPHNSEEPELPAHEAAEAAPVAVEQVVDESFSDTVEQPQAGDAGEPVVDYVEQPDAFSVEQPPMEEQNDSTEDNTAETGSVSEPDTVVEFEVAADESPVTPEVKLGPEAGAYSQETTETSEPEANTSVTEEFTEPLADQAVYEAADLVSDQPDRDETIIVSAADDLASPESQAVSFGFDDSSDSDIPTYEVVDTSSFPFALARTDERSGPFWEPYVHSAGTESGADVNGNGSMHTDLADVMSAKTEEIPVTEDFHSQQIVIPAAVQSDDDIDGDPFKTVAQLSIPTTLPVMASADGENSPFTEPAEAEFVRTVVASVPNISECSFCRAANETSSISCHSCMAVLTLSDLEMVIGNRNADSNVINAAIAQMESDRKLRDFNEAELTMLGIGHLNIQNFQTGYNYLYEASRLNPNNVVLSSQVNALLIRLEDIRKHDETAEAMVKGKTILVVDDSPTVRKLIAGKLEKCGHKVFCSADGVEAVEVLSETKPDLILLDINMPRMDGYQTCKAIRANEETKSVPVVMISGKDGFFDKVRGRMAGTTGYITKPFGPETLMKAVEAYLSGDGESEPQPEVDMEFEA